jgi:hypothetical protein
MNLRELVDHIRSGPAKLVLDKPQPVRFQRFSRFAAVQRDDQNCRVRVTRGIGYRRRRVGLTCQDAWEN